jgi:hypothetical protein
MATVLSVESAMQGIFAHTAISNYWPAIAPIAFLAVLSILIFILPKWFAWPPN